MEFSTCRKIGLYAFRFLIILLLFSATSRAQLANTPWPMFQHDLQHTGRSPYAGPDNPTIQWSRTLHFTNENKTPILDASGNLYIGGMNFLGIKPDNSIQWDLPYNGTFTTAVLAADGTLYITHGTGNTDLISALNPDGSEKWSYECRWQICSSPAIGADGTIYFGNNAGFLYALTPAGKEKWIFYEGGGYDSAPAIAGDGTIYIGSPNGKLYAVWPQGTKKWAFETGAEIRGSASIAKDGTVYIGSNDQNLYAIRPDGSEKWRFSAGGAITCSPAIGPEGTVYFTTQQGVLYAVNPASGAQIFMRVLTQSPYTSTWSHGPSPIVDANGVIYTGSGGNDGTLYAIHPDNTVKWSITLQGDLWPSLIHTPILADDGTIYVTDFQGTLYALSGEAQQPQIPLLSYYSDRIDFGSILVGGPGLQSVGLFNTGTADLTVSNVQIGGTDAGRFSLQDSSPSGVIPAGGSKEIIVKCTPQSGVNQAFMQIISDAASSPDTIYFHAVGALGVSASAWPVFQRDQQRSGQSDLMGPDQSMLAWAYPTGGDVRSSAVVDEAGNLYVGSNDGYLYALKADGSLLWNCHLGGEIHAAPALTKDGTIYVTSTLGMLYAVDNQGSEKWRLELDSAYPIEASPVIGADGTIFVGSTNGFIYAVYQDGSIAWS
ncbi:PQQ-binding-like beta-propeller repeat protein, partial [candidate division KSB1 bacterium]|nr:PQQ-binding-like beta-propeller repeat protein [candidate division KSB1 bacterium]